jgi:acyl-CoA dehydrogenase family member 9
VSEPAPATTPTDAGQGPPDVTPDPVAPSLAKGLFLGELHQDLATPYPRMPRQERRRVAELIGDLHDIAAERYDPAKVEDQRWIGDDVGAAMGEAGLLGLYVPERYGGLGLSQTAYCRVSEEFGRIDGTLATVMGVHQSIGTKGIHLFGSDEQKERFLPDLAAGRKLAGFALTEPTTGSDAYDLQTRAERESDGTWRLNGEKRWIGNGNRDVVVCFARSEEHGHVALILTPDLDGFESPFRYDTMGLRGNDLRHLTFDDVRVPPENLLGEPGDGFHIAMNVLNNGRMSLGTGSIGAVKHLLDLTVEHVQSREQFGQPIGDFELVQEKIAWMTTHLYGLESTAYLTTGMMDAGVEDVSLESAMVKVAGTEFLWYAANRAFQLAGGEAYMNDRPYAKILRDIRIFPIFEGANDVLRSFIALSGLKVLGDELEELGDLDLLAPVRSGGLILDHVMSRVRRRVSPPRLTHVHPDLRPLAEPLSEQVATLRTASEQLLRDHGAKVKAQQHQQKRLAHAAMDLVAQVATLSRATAIMNEQGADATATDGRQAALQAETLLALLRMRMMPYWYTSFALYHFEGIPPFRAMNLEEGFNDISLKNQTGSVDLETNPYEEATRKEVKDQMQLLQTWFASLRRDGSPIVVPLGFWHDGD